MSSDLWLEEIRPAPAGSEEGRQRTVFTEIHVAKGKTDHVHLTIGPQCGLTLLGSPLPKTSL